MPPNSGLPYFFKRKVSAAIPAKIKKGFTLIEVFVVFMIVIILASLSVPDFTKQKQGALDNRAKTNLSLILASQRIYYFKMGFYYPNTGQAGASDINSTLRLNVSDANWQYGIISGGSNVFTATARQSDGRTFQITPQSEEASRIQ